MEEIESPIPRDVLTEIEVAFKKGWLYIVAATSTLVEGVNLPVKTLIVSDNTFLRIYNPARKRWESQSPLSLSDYRNMSGRAGRAFYDTEGQVIFIQPITNTGFPYHSTIDDIDEYLSLDADSSELNIDSTLADEGVLQMLSQLVDKVDGGEIDDYELLFGLNNQPMRALIDKIRTLTLLLGERFASDNGNVAFVEIFQHTLAGVQKPSLAPSVLGDLSKKINRSLRLVVDQRVRSLFAQTGLKLATCQELMMRVRGYWENHGTDIHNFLESSLDKPKLLEIADMIYFLDDEDIDPQRIRLARPGSGRYSMTFRHLQNDSLFLAEWILYHDGQLIERHFNIGNDSIWMAEEYIRYTQQTMGYRVPWLMSAFWIFSKDTVEQVFGIELFETKLGRELFLLPSYAKFGVNTPAAALFSAIGVNPTMFCRSLGELYQLQFPDDRFNYQQMLRWLAVTFPTDTQSDNDLNPSYIRRLNGVLSMVRPLDESGVENYSKWEMEFPIAGWQQWGERADVIGSLREEDQLYVAATMYSQPFLNATSISVKTSLGSPA